METNENPSLIIRSARTEQLLAYLSRNPRYRCSILTSSRDRMPGDAEILDAPAGPMRWGRLAGETKRALEGRAWEEIVILHNGGSDYVPIYIWAGRLPCRSRIVIVMPDQTEIVCRPGFLLPLDRAAVLLTDALVNAVLVLLILPLYLLAVCRITLRPVLRGTRILL